MRGGLTSIGRALGPIGLLVLCSLAHVGRARAGGEDEPPAPVGSTGAEAAEAPTALDPARPTSECLAEHARAQELRLDRRLLDARATLRSCSQPDCPSMIRVDCVAWLEEVERSVPSIVLAARSERGDETAVRVAMDGVVIAGKLDGRALELDPGAHVFRFTLEGYPPVSRSVVLREGDRNRVVTATFAAPAAPPPPVAAAHPGPPALAVVLGGLAVVGLAGSATFGIAALEYRDERRDACAPVCDVADERALRKRAVAADVTGGIGLLAAGGTAYVLLRHRSHERRTPRAGARVAVGVTGTGVGVSVGGALR